jgi:ATP phosphoribosyltransferase
MNALALDHATAVLVPKNRGLAAQVARVLSWGSDLECVRTNVRGEDVPYLANELVRAGRRVLAFTGDDLIEEWLADGNTLDPKLQRSRTLWFDPEAIYGAPALCLIGEPSFDKMSALGDDKLRIAVCARYRRQAQRFLKQWAACAIPYELLPIAGSVETVLLHGIAALIIDVVVTGRTIAAAGLHVHRVISTSDLAILESLP